MSQKDFDDNYDFPKQFRRDTDTLLFIKQGGDLYRQCQKFTPNNDNFMSIFNQSFITLFDKTKCKALTFFDFRLMFEEYIKGVFKNKES